MSGYRPAGFTRDPAHAYWLTCNDCEEQELFYSDVDARAWVEEHRADHKRWVAA